MTIKAIRNNVLFQFVDAVNTNNQFVKGATESGIVLAGDTFDSSAKESRWVNVIAVGPDVKHIKVGEQALLPALRWTEGIKHDGVKFWKTDEHEVAAVRAHADAEARPLANWVLFIQQKQQQVRQVGLIAVVGAKEDTARGQAFAAGPDADPIMKTAKFVYSDVNFTNTIKHGGVEIAFIKDDDVLLALED